MIFQIFNAYALNAIVKNGAIRTLMPNAWFRCYSEILDDAKVQMMSEVDQRRLIMLFALRCEGALLETFRETQIAFRLRVSLPELLETKKIFIENGFIDERWNVLNWNKRQYISDSSTARVRQYRERLKQDETLQKQDETEVVTPPEQNRTDTDTDTEQKHKEQILPAKKKPSRGTKSNLIKSRHEEFKVAIGKYWVAKNPGVEMPWGPAEGRNLAMWLKESPTTTVEQFTLWLRNRFKSDVNHSERPSRWIGNVTNFANSPIDTYGKPKNSNGGKNVPISNGTGNQIMGVFKETIERRQRNRSLDEDGNLSPSVETRPDDTGIIHAVSTAPRLEGVSGSDEEYLDL